MFIFRGFVLFIGFSWVAPFNLEKLAWDVFGLGISVGMGNGVISFLKTVVLAFSTSSMTTFTAFVRNFALPVTTFSFSTGYAFYSFSAKFFFFLSYRALSNAVIGRYS